MVTKQKVDQPAIPATPSTALFARETGFQTTLGCERMRNTPARYGRYATH